MRKIISKLLFIFFLVSVLCVTGLDNLPACAVQKVEPAKNLKCIHELKFGGVYLEMTSKDFNALGFEYGDSVTISFSNGYVLEDIPYYSGYYTEVKHPLLIFKPSYQYLKAVVNFGEPLWETAKLDENCTAEISLREKGKYLSIQKARELKYSNDREAYSSDEVFADFRSMNIGKLKKNFVYRSASPCDNSSYRAKYTDKLMAQAGIKFIFNLADDDEHIKNYMSKSDFNSPYFKVLYESGKVWAEHLSVNYTSESYKAKVVAGLKALTENEGPFLVHCTLGTDRTGFVCMLIGILAEASYDEILEDYMRSYYNYYGIEKNSDAYNAIAKSVFDPMFETVAGNDKNDLSKYAEKFLKENGMSDEEIAKLKSVLLL